MSILSQLKALGNTLDRGELPVELATDPLGKLRALESRFDNRDIGQFHLWKQLEACFKYSLIGMCLVSLKGRFLKVNPKCCEIWERSETELLHLHWQDITYPDDVLADELQIDKTTVQEDLHGYTMLKRYIMPSGELKPCILRVVLIDDPVTEAPMYFVSQITSLNEIVEIANNFTATDVLDERRGE